MTQSPEDKSPAAPVAQPADELAVPGAPCDEAAERRPWGLSFYLFLEPFAVGKVVVDLAGESGPGGEILRRAGAAEVLLPERPGLPLPYSTAGVDFVICGLGTAEIVEEARRSSLFAEVRRILRPEGVAVVRVVAGVLARAAAEVTPRAALADLALEHFSTVDIVEETPFRAVSYFVPGSDDLAVSEAVAKVGGKPSHLIALCTSAAVRPWQLSESLLVPTGLGESAGLSDGELAAWQAEVERLSGKLAGAVRERDEMREHAMVVEDQSQRLHRTVSTLRKDVERYLRQISDDATARELLTLERDQLRRLLLEAQQRLALVEREAETHKVSAQALKKEVARLRAARGAAGTGRGPG